MTTKHTRGEVREDGRMFWIRQATGQEVWLWPVAFFLRSSESNLRNKKYRACVKGAPLHAARRPSEPMPVKDVRVGTMDSEGRVFLGYLNKRRERGCWGTPADLAAQRALARSFVREYHQRRRDARDMARGYCKWRPRTTAVKPRAKRVRLSPDEKARRIKLCRARVKKREREERRRDPVLRAMHQRGIRLRHFMTGRSAVGATEVGCTRELFRAWMAKQFTKDMSWDNYGKVWSVDHLLPQAWFRADEHARRYLMNHYTNLRPLLSFDNTARGDRVTRSEFSLALQRVPDEWRDTVFELASKAPPLLENPEDSTPDVQKSQCFTC